MAISRRQMLMMSALTLASFTPVGRLLAGEKGGPVDAGPVSDYAKEAIYSAFAAQGFFVIRRGDKIVAQSSICTHRRCKLTPESDGFSCKCHHSAFDLDGKVTRAPAKEDLCRYAIRLDESKHVVVDLSKPIKPGHFDEAEASISV